MSMLILETHASPVMVDHFNFRSRLKLILVFISFFCQYFQFLFIYRS